MKIYEHREWTKGYVLVESEDDGEAPHTVTLEFDDAANLAVQKLQDGVVGEEMTEITFELPSKGSYLLKITRKDRDQTGDKSPELISFNCKAKIE